MYTVRPYQLFTLVKAVPAERIAHIQIPPRRGAGGVTLLETFLIVTATHIVSARRIFEFGTYLGSTTLNLALNTPDDAQILTLDLDENSVSEIQQDAADIPLTQTHFAAGSSLDFKGSSVSHKIRILTGNSVTFDFLKWRSTIDFVFIDGGHDLNTVKSDTQNAFELAAKITPSCIMWHDYKNPDYRELTSYLDELAQKKRIFHVGDTMLCTWFNDAARSITSNLMTEE